MRNKKEGKYIWLSVGFFLFFLLIVLIWLIFKSIFLIYSSQYNLKNDFIVDLYNGNHNQIILFKGNNKIIIINLNNISHNEIQSKYEIPIDEYFLNPEILKSSSDLIKKELFKNNLINLVDRYKFLYKFNSSTIEVLNYTFDNKDNILPSVFIDNNIKSENKTVAIVNATGIEGYATNLASLLNNIGINVISTSASPNIANSSKIIYTGTSSYTLSRITKILNITTNETSNIQIADIVITLGKDQIGTNKY